METFEPDFEIIKMDAEVASYQEDFDPDAERPDAARSAVSAAGLRPITEFERIGVAVASGTADQIEAARTQPGVTYLEGNTPIAFSQETSNTATRGAEAASTLSTIGVSGAPVLG